MKPCKQCQTQFEITDQDRAFYKKMDVPEPTWCPDCRRMKRLMFQNQINLYRRKCALTGKDILAMFNPSSLHTIYANDVYWSDQWDPYKYGRDFDSSKTFFEQMRQLHLDVPKQAFDADVSTMENSEFCNACGHLKDCYLVFFADFNEKCYYTIRSSNCRDSVDLCGSQNLELCFQCTQCDQCYNCKYCFECVNCTDCLFSFNLTNCQNCFGCFNLKNKKYCIYNEQKTPEVYKEFISALKHGSRQSVKRVEAEVKEKTKKRKVRLYFGIKNEDVSGNYIFNSKDAHYCFEVHGLEHAKFCDSISLGKVTDAWDFSIWGNDCQLIYDSTVCGEGAYNLKWCLGCWPACSNLEYCIDCHTTSDCFGSAGLKKGQYSILNKRYNKEEYEKLKAHIISHMKETGEYGDFFPVDFAPYAYNESCAGFYGGALNKQEVLARGWKWEDNLPGTFGKETLKQDEVPDDIQDVTEELAKEILACVDCGKNYKVIKQEIVFYKKVNVPVPEKCFLCRFQDHFKKLPGFKLYDRECAHCKKNIKTVYAPTLQNDVLCEQCYLKEVV